MYNQGMTLQLMWNERRSGAVRMLPHGIKFAPNAAQKMAGQFLSEYVTMMARPGIPTLLSTSTNNVWEIPILLKIPNLGVVGTAGKLQIDAQTGELDELTETEIAHIQELCHAMAYAATTLSPTLS